MTQDEVEPTCAREQKDAGDEVKSRIMRKIDLQSLVSEVSRQ